MQRADVGTGTISPYVLRHLARDTQRAKDDTKIALQVTDGRKIENGRAVAPAAVQWRTCRTPD